MRTTDIQILSFSPELAEYFKTINLLWIEHYFEPEPEDLKVLTDPQKYLIDTGGAIVFAQYQGQIVGTCGLKKWHNDEYELVKMGVLDGFQGLQLGYHLGQAIIEQAQTLGCKRLFLETNSQLTAARHLYQKLGFKEVTFECSRSDYQRCDVIMECFL
ncbi:GNAT family N-acetyltransferase [Kangiella sp. TOML190]|uniref:GNAT family N-acetyltransferase n=1 Tax=Kangiella sp. TOML190 TaxID=2931351 RepID=UPI00203ADA51|nr:GNAT family N-acetyltransferase [Kangiella sp. TOML190]